MPNPLNESYNPQLIESQVQKDWHENAVFEVTEKVDKEKFYCLAMFPYPSGRLHMGHVRNYTITDVISRFQRMQGKNVLHPMGWDAFGLPAENAAIKHKTAPAKWTYSNTDYMRTQLKALGFGFDWSRELATCKPDYYRWEQWFFTRLYEKGMAYKKVARVNWCPNDETVLANEQVEEGCCWRCGETVEQKEIPQWFIRITDYAEELLGGLDDLPHWPEQVKTMQRNWIGKSRGLQMRFNLETPIGDTDHIEVYTTRPDTLMGVTYVSLACGHPIAEALAKEKSEIATFIKQHKAQSVSEADMANLPKKGIATGLKVLHPITGEAVPLWIANYVLMDYGSGAVMAVPAHDERDFDFAKQYGLSVKQVIEPLDSTQTIDTTQAAYTEKGRLIHSNEFDGLTFEDAFEAIRQTLETAGLGRATTNYRLRDWGVSRQRYWGTPIPMLYLAEGGEIPVPADRLPVLLPEDVEMDGIKSPIKADAHWKQTHFNNKQAEHETDTFDTFMESSWYYARYCCPDADSMLDKTRADYWLPVDQYVGGIEHAILHLLYARFFHKLMRDEGLVSCDEPFERLLCQGMVNAESFYKKEAGKTEWLAPDEIEVEKDEKGQLIRATEKSTGDAVTFGGVIKMSKSKNNGVDPESVIQHFGADTVRLFTMFAAPPEQGLEWTDSGVEGASRFLKRLWRLVYEHLQAGTVISLTEALDSKLSENSIALRRKTHETIKKVSDDFARRYTFNTAIAAVMELLNEVSKHADRATDTGRTIEREALESAICMLSPIVPHITHTLWEALGHQNLLDAPWPNVDEKALVKTTTTIVVQVNGKVRAKLDIAVDMDKASLEQLALKNEHVQRFTQDKTLRKIIVVPNKLVNIVAN